MKRKRLTKKQKKVLWRFGSLIAGIFLLTIVIVAEKKFSSLVLGGLGEQFSTQVFSAPLYLKSGPQSSRILLRLRHRLDKLGYKQTSTAPAEPGQYQLNGADTLIYLRGFECPIFNQPAQPLHIHENNSSLELTDDQNAALEEVALEPVLIDTLSGAEKIRREPATWEEIPVRLANAVVAVEDADFYHHWGVSPKAVARAFLKNIIGKGNMQGGSTITQQLAKNLFLSPKRTLRRKFTELFFAMYLEMRFEKERIMTLYLNQIYMGQDGLFGIAGVKTAARYYFDKELSDLNLTECAFLAGLIRSPYKYNPNRDFNSARERMFHVLDRMLINGFISTAEAKEAKNTPLQVHTRTTKNDTDRNASYYVAEVVRQLSPKYGEDDIFRLGLRIYTALDPDAQMAAQKAVSLARPQGALVALDPQTGDVSALAGGTDFGLSQFNRATQAKRQPGSAFKPFVYGAALESGETLATQLNDEQKSFRDGKKGKWTPKNYDRIYRGPVSFRTALAQSLNSATVSLVDKITPAKVISFAERMGISSPLEKSLALALGTSEVTLLEITSAYSPFSNGGFRVAPRLVLAVADAEGQTLDLFPMERTSVMSPGLAELMTSLLQSVVTEGTAKSLPLLGWGFPTAGKTGTTNDGRDAWFIGYTPEILAGVWVGADSGPKGGLSGSKNAVPVWASFMKLTYEEAKSPAFAKSPDLVRVKIDAETGYVAVSGCPHQNEELFLDGTQPTKECPLHPGGVKGWFHKFFGGK